VEGLVAERPVAAGPVQADGCRQLGSAVRNRRKRHREVSLCYKQVFIKGWITEEKVPEWK
jgi:hypothetical protein